MMRYLNHQAQEFTEVEKVFDQAGRIPSPLDLFKG